MTSWGVLVPDLRAKGMNELCIVDASAIPYVPNAHGEFSLELEDSVQLIVVNSTKIGVYPLRSYHWKNECRPVVRGGQREHRFLVLRDHTSAPLFECVGVPRVYSWVVHLRTLKRYAASPVVPYEKPDSSKWLVAEESGRIARTTALD